MLRLERLQKLKNSEGIPFKGGDILFYHQCLTTGK